MLNKRGDINGSQEKNKSGVNGINSGNIGNIVYSGDDYLRGVKMRRRILQAISLIISSLALLYLLFINIYREAFIISDWVVVAFDLFVKVIIEIVLLTHKGENENE